MENKNNKKGFTLIELLVSIGIIALLTTIVFIVSNNMTNTSKEVVSMITEQSLTDASIIYVKEFRTNDQFWHEEENGYGKFTCLSINQLSDKGILKGKIVDAVTGDEVDKNTVIKVTKDINSVIINKIEKNSDDCDKVVPIIKITIEGTGYDIKDKMWYTDEVSYKIEPTVGPSGVSEYNYYIEINGKKREVEKGTTLKVYEGTLSDSGNNIKICAEVINGSGVTSGVVCESVNVDNIIPSAPTITSSDNKNSGSWHNDSFDLNFNVSNKSPSGVEYFYGYSETIVNTKISGSKISVTSNENGKTVYVKACSKVNKCSQISNYVVKMDVTNPTVTITAKEKTSGTTRASNTWSKEGLNFTLTQGTVGSSGATIYYCKDTKNTCTPTTKATSGTAITGYNTVTGTYYIRYKIISGAGKSSSTESYTAKVDTIPIISIGSDIEKYKYESYDLWNGVSITGTGVSEKKVTINNKEIANTNQLEVGNYVATYYVKTAHGNEVTQNRNIKILSTKKTYQCVEKEEEYVVPVTGYYSVIANGAQGSNNGGLGGKIYGKIKLNKGEKLNINVGCTNGYNGGGINSTYSSGGGATTVQKNSENILIAGGGGGSLSSNVNSLTSNSQGGVGNGTGAVNGTNGGGGAASMWDTEMEEVCVPVSNPNYQCTPQYEFVCSKYKENCTSTSPICLQYGQKQVCIPMFNSAPICYSIIDTSNCINLKPGTETCVPTNECEKGETIVTGQQCNSPIISQCNYVSKIINGIPGNGGKNSVSDNYINNLELMSGQQSGNGNFTIEYVGE